MYNGEYFLFSKLAPTKVLDVSQNQYSFGKLVLFDYHGQGNQIFKITQLTESNPPFYSIQSRKSKKFLTVQSYSHDNGKNIIQEAYQNLDAQKFIIKEIYPGEIILYTFCGKAVDIANCSSANDTPIIQWQFNSGANQIWILKHVQSN